MGQVLGVSANPTTVDVPGSSVITPQVQGDPATDRTATVTVSLDGTSASTLLTVHKDAEALTYSVDPADKNKPGFVVAETDIGTLVNNGDGTFTLQE